MGCNTGVNRKQITLWDVVKVASFPIWLLPYAVYEWSCMMGGELFFSKYGHYPNQKWFISYLERGGFDTKDKRLWRQGK